jgi:predicted glycoside hydrolase/deacetylase ChbG (UPF0249 family)
MRIVLNADDFGLSPDTVRATIDCFERGELTSASIMPAMPATDDAIAFALANSQYSFGVHLTFVGDGDERPVAPPQDVPALVDDTGRLRRTNLVRLRAMLRRLPPQQLEREITAQISAVRDRGVQVTHVDSHRHLHKYKPITAALKRVLPQFGIERVRNVQDVYLRRPLRSPTYWFGSVWRRRLMRSFATTDHFYMATSAGDDDWSPLLERLHRDGTLEIGVHPGVEGWRGVERNALQAFAEAARREHTFVTWKEVGDHALE